MREPRPGLSRPRTRIRLASAAALLAALALAPPPTAAVPVEPAAPSAAELKQLPIEALLEVEVTSAAKRPQALTETAATVSVITGEEIRRSGARSLPEALRLAPGINVARFDSRTWAISARGFNATTANKMLVLIDGRSVYTPLFSGVFWDVQNPLLEDVERIEVVRGPGATLWGANAVNGVINVITRDAASTQGDLAVLAGGDRQRAFAAYRHGGAIRGDQARGRYRTYVEYDYRDGLVTADGSDVDDPLRIAQAGFRADLEAGAGDLTLQGDVYGGRIGHPTFDDTDVFGGNVLGQWSRHLGTGSDLVLRGYYDHTFRDVPTQFRERRHTLDLEFQHRWQRGRHDLLWGGGWRGSRDRVGTTPLIAWDPAHETITVGNLFAQDELRLTDRWRVLARPARRGPVDDGRPAAAGADARLAGVARPAALGRRRARGAGADAHRPRHPHPRHAARRSSSATRTSRRKKSSPTSWAGGWRRRRRRCSKRWPSTTTTTSCARRSRLRPSACRSCSATAAPRACAASASAAAGRRSNGCACRAPSPGSPQRFTVEPGSRDQTGGAAEANDPDYHWSLRADLALPRDVELSAWLRHVAELPSPAGAGLHRARPAPRLAPPRRLGAGARRPEPARQPPPRVRSRRSRARKSRAASTRR